MFFRDKKCGTVASGSGVSSERPRGGWVQAQEAVERRTFAIEKTLPQRADKLEYWGILGVPR